MPRVIGIDPGTISLDLCGLDDGGVFLNQSFPTSEALADPSRLVDILERAAPLDLVAGPSGYGLPLIASHDLTETDIRLAFLPDVSRRLVRRRAGSESGSRGAARRAAGATAEDQAAGGIVGLRRLVRALAGSSVRILLTPGVVHLPSVPPHRKVNRVDMGTADKVCAVALAVHEQITRRGCDARRVSLILLELGGAFTAAIAVEDGRIVDGLGGTSGPLGLRAAGALDGEVAFLAGGVTKRHLFSGGVATIAGTPEASSEALAAPSTSHGRLAWEAYLENAVKAVATLAVSAPKAADVLLSGRVAHIEGVREELTQRLASVLPRATVATLSGFGGASKQAAQGAALIADGLAGGRFASIVEALGIRDACGTVLDHLHVISPDAARKRIGLP